jgi:hypothetical protein
MKSGERMEESEYVEDRWQESRSLSRAMPKADPTPALRSVPTSTAWRTLRPPSGRGILSAVLVGKKLFASLERGGFELIELCFPLASYLPTVGVAVLF